MKNDEIDNVVFEKIIQKKQALMMLDKEDIFKLPAVTMEEIKVEDKILNMCIYNDSLSNDESLIVVQCKNTRFWRYGNIFAEGFVINRLGEKREAEKKLMWACL
jgi:hypothetical protein